VPDKEREQLVHMDQNIMNKLAALPGVTSVSFSSSVPLDGHNNSDVLFAEDHHYAEGQIPPLRRFEYISPGYFATMGTPLIAGRDLTWEDTYQKLPVALISENFAKEYWGSAENALGKRIRVGSTDDWREIIGVVGDVHELSLSQPASSEVYWPVMQDKFEGQKEMVRRGLTFVIRSPRAGSQTFMNEVRQTAWSEDSNVPVARLRTVGYYFKRSMARTSFTLVMLGVAGSMALLLGIVGIYGVIAYSVSQRTREIGIRMALGAQEKSLVAMFVRHGLLLTGIGVAFGLAGAFAAMRLMSSLLFNVKPVDPITYAAVIVCVLLTAYVACYLPSRRAATVNPTEALRAE
jgi:predicted permease